MTLGLLGVAELMRYVPRAVSVGFVNALGILLFVAQWPNLEHIPAVVYALVAGGVAIIFLFPRLTKVVPATHCPCPASPTCRSASTRSRSSPSPR